MKQPIPHTSWKLLYYQGQLFERSCVLKFLLSVEEACAWVRDDLDIPYPVGNPDASLTQCVNYVPDMLIRNWTTGRAELIQIVPGGFDDFEWLAALQALVKLHCAIHELDWKFQVVFEEDIVLDDDQQRRFLQLVDDRRARILEFSSLLYQNYSGLSDAEYDAFVRYDCLPALVP